MFCQLKQLVQFLAKYQKFRVILQLIFGVQWILVLKKVQKIGIIPGFGGAGFSFGSELKKECTFFK